MINLCESSSNREKVCLQIQEFLLKKSATFMQIVEICAADKAAVSDFLDELVNEGKVVIRFKRKHGLDKYALSDKGKEMMNLFLEKQKIKTRIDQMSHEKFQEFKKFFEALV